MKRNGFSKFWLQCDLARKTEESDGFLVKYNYWMSFSGIHKRQSFCWFLFFFLFKVHVRYSHNYLTCTKLTACTMWSFNYDRKIEFKKFFIFFKIKNYRAWNMNHPLIIGRSLNHWLRAIIDCINLETKMSSFQGIEKTSNVMHSFIVVSCGHTTKHFPFS